MENQQHYAASAAPLRVRNVCRINGTADRQHSLETLQYEAFERSCAQWPTVTFAFEDFRDYLMRLGYQDHMPSEAASVYLCGACMSALPTAHRTLELTYFRSLRRAISPYFNQRDAIEDVLQDVRYRLFVGPSARIAGYRGSGPLGAWLRSVALNVARDHVRDQTAALQRVRRYGQSFGHLALDENLHNITPEDRMGQTEMMSSYERALVLGMRLMTVEDRQILRHYFVEGMNIDQIGRMYACNRSTAARRINRALQKLRSAFRRALDRAHMAPSRSMLVASHAMGLSGDSIFGPATSRLE